MFSATDPRWIEISLTVDGELAESVADVLERYTSHGVVIESGVIMRSAEDEGTPYGPVRVFGYLPCDEMVEQTRQQIEESLWHLSQIRSIPAPVYKPIADADWMEAWKQHYQPMRIGKRFIIVPAWLDVESKGLIPIRINPGMAFGTGAHPTTQLCLELIERWANAGKTAIDIGCGSGILTVAALKLGFHKALAVDIDSQAVKSTLENATLNEVVDLVETGVGSVDEIRKGAFSIRSAELVLANILAPVLIRMLDGYLKELLSTDGTLILSGILKEQSPEVEEAACRHELHLVDKLLSGDWVALAFQKTQAI
jgi:ribosomal protein L11 methyltransferase